MHQFPLENLIKRWTLTHLKNFEYESNILGEKKKARCLKGKFTQKNLLISDVRSDKIGKNAVDRFSISLLVLKIFAFKVEKIVIWKQPS